MFFLGEFYLGIFCRFDEELVARFNKDLKKLRWYINLAQFEEATYSLC